VRKGRWQRKKAIFRPKFKEKLPSGGLLASGLEAENRKMWTNHMELLEYFELTGVPAVLFALKRPCGILIIHKYKIKFQ
jgi:hypothetical protein